MKKCNVCGCIVDEKSVCPICGNTLTYEPTVTEDKEKFVWNKYYLIYLLKTSWFSVACLIYGIATAIICPNCLNKLMAIATFFTLASLILSVFERQYASKIRWRFTKEYSFAYTKLYKYITGIVAIIFYSCINFI